jgi:hypothetical protein
MSNNKTKQAFPGRTGMGIERGMSKLEYISTQFLLHYLRVRDENPETVLFDIKRLSEQAIYDAQQLLKACEAAEKGSN